MFALAALTVGATGAASDVGGAQGDRSGGLWAVHGGRSDAARAKKFDGMPMHISTGTGGSFLYTPNLVEIEIL